MNIDIEKEREWWTEHGDGVYGPQSTEIAFGYLDELEATRSKLDESDKRCEQLMRAITCNGEDTLALRTQLTDQRAHSIRMMAVAAYGTGIEERDISRMAAAYDRLSAIPVPPPREVERG